MRKSLKSVCLLESNFQTHRLVVCVFKPHVNDIYISHRQVVGYKEAVDDIHLRGIV